MKTSTLVTGVSIPEENLSVLQLPKNDTQPDAHELWPQNTNSHTTANTAHCTHTVSPYKQTTTNLMKSKAQLRPFITKHFHV